MFEGDGRQDIASQDVQDPLSLFLSLSAESWSLVGTQRWDESRIEGDRESREAVNRMEMSSHLQAHIRWKSEQVSPSRRATFAKPSFSRAGTWWGGQNLNFSFFFPFPLLLLLLFFCIYIKMPAINTLLLIGSSLHSSLDLWLACFRAAHRAILAHGWAPGLETPGEARNQQRSQYHHICPHSIRQQCLY